MDVDCEEMEYVDGGGSITYNQLVDKLLQFGAVTGMVIYRYGFKAIVNVLTAAASVVKAAIGALGVAGKIISWYVGVKLGIFIGEIAEAIDKRRGLDYGFNWTGPYLYCQ